MQLFKLVGHPVSEDQIDNLIRAVDKNNDGAVDFDEFCSMLEREHRQSREEELSQFFSIFDPQRKGYVSAEQLQRTLSEMGEAVTMAEAEAMIRFADADGDGKVTREDFMISFTQKHTHVYK